MAINTIATATLFQNNLDKAAAQQSMTGWMESNAGQVIYKGGSEVKIPKLNMDGLANYSRTDGFVDGGIDFSYQTREMTCDRGRSFSFDELYVDETNFVVTASTTMGEFQRLKVVPEIDAYRLSKVAQVAMSHDKCVEYGYSPTKSSIVDKIREGIRTLKKKHFTDGLICYVTYDVEGLISNYFGDKIAAATFAINGVDTRVPSIDGVPIIATPDEYMVSKIKLLDGESSGEESGGFEKASDGLDVNFQIISTRVPIAVQKTDNMRIFSPEINQKKRAWAMDYRKFHDVWVLDNKKDGIFLNIKDSKPVSIP